MKMKSNYKNYLHLAGGILLNSVTSTQVAGNLNSWGSISPYIASYFHNQDPSTSISDFVIVNSIAYTTSALYTVFFSYLSFLLSPILIIFAGVSLACSSLFLSSFIHNPTIFCWIYGMSLGILSSSVFLPTVWILWSIMPLNKGKISGILLGGYNFGPVPFLIIFTYLANPHNYSADKIEQNGESKDKYFENAVSDRVPMTIRWISIVYYCICLLGLTCLPKQSNNDTENNSKKKTITMMQMVTNKKFWYFVALLLFGYSVQAYMYNMYRIIGMIYIKDDHYLTYIGTLFFITCTIGRISFGILLDKFSWRGINATSYFFQGLLTIILYFVLDNKSLFLVIIVSLGFLTTSVYNGALILSERTFPKDKWIFSFACLSYIIIYFMTYLIDKFITPKIGYFFTFCIIGSYGFIACIISIWPPEPLSDNLTDQLLISIKDNLEMQ